MSTYPSATEGARPALQEGLAQSLERDLLVPDGLAEQAAQDVRRVLRAQVRGAVHSPGS